jgi:hypothetical protein
MVLKKPASAGFLLPRKRGWLILMLPGFPLLAVFCRSQLWSALITEALPVIKASTQLSSKGLQVICSFLLFCTLPLAPPIPS